MYKKNYFLFFLVLIVITMKADDFGVPSVPRKVDINPHQTLRLADKGKILCEIVISDTASPIARFAAEELQKYVSESVGGKVPLVEAPSGEKISLIVGGGLETTKLPRDGFIIKGEEKKIIIAGRDDKTYFPKSSKRPWGDYYERATLFAVYDFLERFLDVKFVFPGDAGTVVPRHEILDIPMMDIIERPDNICRSISWYSGELPDGFSGFDRHLNNYRLRMQTAYIPNNHGLGRMAYIERFGKTNPKYFALRSNGSRSNNLAEKMGGQLCLNSGIVEEIYQDAKAYLSGQTAKSRGIWHSRYKAYTWDLNAVQPGFFNLMPQDGMILCQCEVCCENSAGKPNWNSERVWRITADIGKRLKAEQIEGYITQMAYGRHRKIPPFDIPDNVLVMVAENGPWSVKRPGGLESQLRHIHDWSRKINKKVWIWTYVCKYAGTNILNVPCSTPLAVADFYTKAQPDICGSFMESESDFAVFQFFNWYVFSKIMWDKSTDPQRILQEAYSALYGAGASDMMKFFERLEELWLTHITGNLVMTASGPTTIPPSDYELWHKIYNLKELNSLDFFLKSAQHAVSENQDCIKRIQFIRKNFYDILLKGRTGFITTQQSVNKLKKEIGKSSDNPLQIFLSGMNDASAEVMTKVEIFRDLMNLHVSFYCEEPFVNDSYVQDLPRDDENIWRNDSVEIFLNPTGKRDQYFQWIINRNGNFADLVATLSEGINKNDYSWESNAEVKAATLGAGWTVMATIPLESLGEISESNMVANFCRSRILTSGKKVTTFYSWSPFIRRYNDIANFGSLSLLPVESGNILEGGTFNVKRNGRFLGKWYSATNVAEYISLDKEFFLSDGQSLKISNTTGENIFVGQYLPLMKGGEKYRLSFSLKTEFESPSAGGGVFLQLNDGKNFSIPRPGIKKSTPWTTYEHTFITNENAGKQSKCFLRLYVYNCKATAWFDNIIIEEVIEE